MPRIIKVSRQAPPPVHEGILEENVPAITPEIKEETKRRLEELNARVSELSLLASEIAAEMSMLKEGLKESARAAVQKAVDGLIDGLKDEIVRAVEAVSLKQVDRETTLAAVREALSAAAEAGMKNAELAVPEDAAKEVAAAVEDLKVKAISFLKEGDCVVEAEEKVLDNRAFTRLRDALAALKESVRKGGETCKFTVR